MNLAPIPVQREEAFFIVEAVDILQRSRWKLNRLGGIRNQYGECVLEALATELYCREPGSVLYFEAADMLHISPEASWIIVNSTDNNERAGTFDEGVREALLTATMADVTGWRRLLAGFRWAWREFKQEWIRP